MPLWPYLALSGLLFGLGLVGLLVRRNAVGAVMAFGLMVNASLLNLAAFARQHGDGRGEAVAFLVLLVGAAELVVGLALAIALFRNRQTADLDELDQLKW